VEFFDSLAVTGLTQLAAIESIHVAAYIEELQRAIRADREAAPGRVEGFG